MRLTEDRHYLSAFDQVTLPKGRGGADPGTRIVYAASTPTRPTDLWALDVPAAGSGKGLATPRRLTALNAELLAEIELVEPVERWVEVDGRAIQGWYIPPTGDAPRPAPLVTEIHGGPHTLYGWSPYIEFQVLAGAGIGVWYCNPRGSEGYGQDFNGANFRDWGPGPTRDVLAGVDALVADGLADPDRLGVTGGSYGGYLTNWIVGHDRALPGGDHLPQRGRPHVARCCPGTSAEPSSVALEFGAAAWEDPTFYREHSPLTYAAADPDAPAHPAQRAGPALHDHPGRGALHGPAHPRPAGPAHARPGREPRADPVRDAVPPGREPRPGTGLVPPLPHRRQARPAPPAARARGEVAGAGGVGRKPPRSDGRILTVP